MTKQVTPPPPGDKPTASAPPAPPRWRHWLWPVALIAFAFLLPYIAWQIPNGWPTLEFWRNYGGIESGTSPLDFLRNVHKRVAENSRTSRGNKRGNGGSVFICRQRHRVAMFCRLTLRSATGLSQRDNPTLGHRAAMSLAPTVFILITRLISG